MSCHKVSEGHQKAQHQLKDIFNHGWLTDKSLALCSDTGIWWQAYLEGEGIYCLVCSKHNTKNVKVSGGQVFRNVPSVKCTKPTLASHASS